MNTKKRILILTCSHGSGHKMVSAALKNVLEKNDCTVIVRDLFNDTNKVVNRIIEKSYLLSYNIGSTLYKKIYYDLEKDAHSKFIYNLWTMTQKTLLGYITEFHPDAIINTYPYTISSILKEDHYPDIPVFTVVTDFCIPAAWTHKNTDKFYVACQNVENHLFKYGIEPERILKTGIPIREAFYKHYDKAALQEKYNLNPEKKTLIICAGTYGVVKNLKQICERVDHLENLQTIVVCGKNKVLYKELSAFPFVNTQVFGFVSDIHEFYCCGDFMMTKPGGITLSETVATRMPIILYKPVPGQEGENAEWFKKSGAAIIANTPTELLIAIESLKDNEFTQYSMKSALRKMYYGHSADLISQDIIKQLDLNRKPEAFIHNELYLLKEV
ncbi:MAG: glycosyltransferase [Eubacterium sp.]